MKKTAAESHRMLVEAYGEHSLGKSQCFEWFKKFRSGNFWREERRTWKTTEKVSKQRIASIVGWGWRSNATTTRWSIKRDTRSRLHTFESHGKDPEGGKTGSTWTEWKTAGKPKNHLRNAARQIRKKVISPPNCDWRWKVDIFSSRRTTDIDYKTTSLWTEDDALRLVGSEGCDLLWAVKTWRNR